MNNPNIDILISGGGMVGLSMAVAAARQGLKIVLVEKHTLPAQLEATFDGRVSAITRGSSLILDDIGAGNFMAPHAEPILDIRVSDGKSPFFVHYDHRDVGSDPLGYIVENRYIRHALQQAAAEHSNLHIIEQVEVTAMNDGDVVLSNGEHYKARLVLATDGKMSRLRDMAGIKTLSKDYGQTAIVCTIGHTKPHGGLAQERFLAAGPFAVLPMTHQRSSLVWVEPNDRVQMYMELDDAEFVQEITERVGDYLGTIHVEGQRFAYPLSLVHATRYVDTRFALLGDAAHSIHPIAGQGVNLGFRDMAALDELIRKQCEAGGDIGAADVLAHYERWRRFDNVSMLGVTNGLNQLFCSSFVPVKIARGLGLWAVERMPALKQFFMKHAMGLVGDLPESVKKRA